MYHENLIFRAVVTNVEVQDEMENTKYFEQSGTADEICEEAKAFTWDSLVEDDEDEDNDVIVIS